MFTTLIKVESLIDNYKKPDWLIFDARYDLIDKNTGRKSYLKAHIPGALYVDLEHDLSRPPGTNKGRHPLPTEVTMKVLFSELGIKRHSQVVIYDDTFGGFSARLWWMLRYMQHQSVAVLDGGWQAWQRHTAMVDNTNEKPNATEFDNTALGHGIVKTEQVEEIPLLIDSREPSRYQGEAEPIDKRAGHIPGALNRFWRENLIENGCFKDKEQLASEFESLFGNIPAAETAFYCGSGVTACHNLLAAVHAGLAQPQLYAGSWSEWSNDPNRPTETVS